MSNSRDQKSDPRKFVVGCLFPLVGGFLGIAIGSIAWRFLEPAFFWLFVQPGDRLGGLVESGLFVVASGIIGLIAFACFELKIRQ